LNTAAWHSVNALTWTRATNSVPFLPRGGHALAAHAGKLWAIGGYGYSGAATFGPNSGSTSGAPPVGDATREVWSSVDGVSWELVDLNAPFPARRGAAALSFNGRLWVIGGGNNTLTGLSTTPEVFNDVWYYE
jgi:N-acetylneuraminic acid mutarotase